VRGISSGPHLVSSSFKLLLYVALGSAIGGVGRVTVGNWLGDHVHVPYRTLVINVTGSFVLGLFLHWAEAQSTGHPNLRALIAVGICGGYTTFSTFAYETVVLMETGAFARAAAYALLSVLGSLGAVFAGFAAAKAIT
jgi:CrcB protein